AAESKEQAYSYLLKMLVEIHVPQGKARVEIDGEPQERLTPGKFALTPGKHRLRLLLDGYEPREAEVVVNPQEAPQRFEIPLKPLAAMKYALLVGVHQPAGGLPDFLHAEPDVVELGRLLVAGGYEPAHVVVLTQTLAERTKAPRPDAATVREALRALLRRCTPADSVLVA